MWLRALTVSLFSLAFITPSHAQLNVDKSILELSNKTNKTNVRLSNSGEDTLYINLNLVEIIDPARSDTESKALTNPATDGIIIHPRQIVLQPGQARTAKVMLSQAVESQDRVFRLNIKPLAGDALPNADAEQSAGVRIMLGYQLLVLARPDKLDIDVEMTRNDNNVVFNNKSNTSVLLRELSACNGDSCTEMTPNRLYPNEVLTVEMPQGLSGQSASIRTKQSVQFTESFVSYEP